MSKREISLLICFIGLFLAGCVPAKPAVPAVMPTITPVPSWHMLGNGNAGFQIWLPPSFLGGTPINIDAIAVQLTEKNPNFVKIPQSLKQRGTPFIVFAVDTNSPPDKITYMVVANEKLTAPLDINSYLDLLAKNLTSQSSLFNVIQKQVLPSDRYPIGKIVVGLNTLESGDIKQVVYALKNGGAVWQISFTTPTEEYDARSPIFEKIARSANVPFIKDATGSTSPINPWVAALIVVVLVIIGYSAWRVMKRPRKVEPVQAQKAVRKKKAKK
jgi:hypothetical protein